MSLHSKVVWSQGMFLLPHHFQQEARHVEHLVDMRLRATGPHAWGFFELALDEGLLAIGKLGISRASGVLPDGTPFSIPQHDAQPMPLDVPADLKSETVYLAVPLAREGVTQVGFDGADAQDLVRWRAGSEELRDHTNAADEPEPVQTGALDLRLLRAKDVNEGYALLGVARVVERRSDNQVVLDRAYIAPQTRIDASQQLSAHASLLHGLIHQRAKALAARMGQLSHGVSEMADFLMLQSLNRAEPVFRQHAQAPNVHPRELHLACLQLAGDLSTFTSDVRLPAEHPLYRHDDLNATFAPVIADLRRMLSTVLERNAMQIDLVDRSHGVRMAVFPDADLARTANFVLAVNAQMPAEQLRTRFPAQSKLGPADRLRDLVNLQLPGVTLRSLPTAPRQLPFHAGFHYFELDRGGELWKQLERSGSLALHVAGDFPALELELWAIRQ
ncbi:MAG TPA: type VI secretion system baseplate subunit TssK [Albitalea sp.]|nr:type VI secretion system baseplate subunit TssK [Albitalea sp.]